MRRELAGFAGVSEALRFHIDAVLEVEQSVIGLDTHPDDAGSLWIGERAQLTHIEFKYGVFRGFRFEKVG